MKKVYFKDRHDAAVQLKEQLPLERLKSEKWHLVAVSSGGLALAEQMNERLKLPIDFLFTEAIYAPQNSECEIARVSETEEIVMIDNLVNSFDIQVDYIYGEASRKHEEKILSKVYRYRKGRHFELMHGKTVLLMDEGCETGLKMMTAIKTIMAMRPKAVYIAVPVLPLDVLESLEPLVDDIFYIQDIEDFVQTTSYYTSLETVDENKIEAILGEK